MEKIFQKISEDITKNMTEEMTVKLIHDTPRVFPMVARFTTIVADAQLRFKILKRVPDNFSTSLLFFMYGYSRLHAAKCFPALAPYQWLQYQKQVKKAYSCFFFYFFYRCIYFRWFVVEQLF